MNFSPIQKKTGKDQTQLFPFLSNMPWTAMGRGWMKCHGGTLTDLPKTAIGRRRFEGDSVLEKGAMKSVLRIVRGWLYRRYPAISRGWYRKKLAGYERRWGLEDHGFTKEGFLRVFRERFIVGNRPGRVYELVAGDGLVGSLGVWLEGLGKGWDVEAWEHRPIPLFSLKKTRLETEIHEGRLIKWAANERKKDLLGITTRGSREAAGVCREIRTCQIRPQWVGLWNPTMRPTWFHRMRSAGYQLVLVYQRMEFYVDAERESGVRGRGRSSKVGKVNE